MITASDTAQSGFDRCELHYIIGDVLVKSDMWSTYTADALGTPAPEAPEPQQAWVDKVLAAGQAAVDASVNAPKIGSNGNWWTWDVVASVQHGALRPVGLEHAHRDGVRPSVGLLRSGGAERQDGRSDGAYRGGKGGDSREIS